uniref:Serpin domain-containing protein n=1 Tax=Varanus komodoensis TaxID=61221 RepID=A0A8D2IKV4_VARKO
MGLLLPVYPFVYLPQYPFPHGNSWNYCYSCEPHSKFNSFSFSFLYFTEQLTRRMNSAIFLCLVLVGLCSVTHGHHVPVELNSTAAPALKLSPANTHFGLELLRQISSASPSKNVIFSPICISSAMALLVMGTNSDSRTQILDTLGFNMTDIQEKEIHDGFHNLFALLTHPDNLFHLDIGEALFVKESLQLLQKFLDDVHAYYDTEILTSNFQEPAEAEKQINSYVEKKTQGKITNLVKGLSPETALVLVNYIIFGGAWKKPFDSKFTTEKDFILADGTKVKVPMMAGSGWFHYLFDEELSCTVLQLDYNGSAIAYFVLPDAGKMEQLEKALSMDILVKWSIGLKTAQVFLPKFNISSSYELKEILSKMGITDIFTDRADLSGITGQPLKVTKPLFLIYVCTNVYMFTWNFPNLSTFYQRVASQTLKNTCGIVNM